MIADDPSPAGLAAALRRVAAASPDERERLGQAARATVLELCAVDRVVGALEALYRGDS